MSYQINRWLLVLVVIIIATVSIIGVAQAVTPLEYGETVFGSIDSITEMDTYTFTASLEDIVLIRMQSSWYDGPQIKLYAPNGTLISHASGHYTYFSEITQVLPDTGEYTILAGDYVGDDTGSYGIFIQRVNNPGNAIPLDFGENKSASIDSKAEMDTYTFTASLEDIVLIRMQSSWYDGPQIKLYAPNGTLISHASGHYTYFSEITQVLPDTGEYTILAGDYVGDDTWSYEIFIKRVNNSGFAPPFANFTYTPENPVVDQVIIFNAIASYDPDGIIMNYEWNFGDGNITSTTENIITHSYTFEGDYDVNLTITDNSSSTNSTNKSVQVVPTGITIDLYTGWNLIGYNSLDSQPIAEALSSINGNYSIVWAYNASDTTDHWKKYDPSVPFGNDLINM